MFAFKTFFTVYGLWQNALVVYIATTEITCMCVNEIYSHTISSI